MSVIFLLTLTSYFFFNNFYYVSYLRLFKKDGFIKIVTDKLNNNSQTIHYKKGKIDYMANYKNNLKEGWSSTYYGNGLINLKRYYINNIADGPEYRYFSNGKLDYKANNFQNHFYGSFYLYSENVFLKAYATFDIKGNTFCRWDYDKNGNLVNMDGLIVSYNFFSKNIKNDSILVFNGDYMKETDNVQSNFNDLYITVAIPPKTNLISKIQINGVEYKDLPIKNNTIVLKNLFIIKGKYDLLVQVRLNNQDGKNLNGMNIERTIYKE